jgi:hypothetical protein
VWRTIDALTIPLPDFPQSLDKNGGNGATYLHSQAVKFPDVSIPLTGTP